MAWLDLHDDITELFGEVAGLGEEWFAKDGFSTFHHPSSALAPENRKWPRCRTCGGRTNAVQCVRCFDAAKRERVRRNVATSLTKDERMRAAADASPLRTEHARETVRRVRYFSSPTANDWSRQAMGASR